MGGHAPEGRPARNPAGFRCAGEDRGRREKGPTGGVPTSAREGANGERAVQGMALPPWPGLSVAEGARLGRGRRARGETGERGELGRRVESWAARLGRAVREERGERAGLMRELGRGVGCWAGLLRFLPFSTSFVFSKSNTTPTI